MIERRVCGEYHPDYFLQQLTWIEEIVKTAFKVGQIIGFNEEAILQNAEAVFRLVPFDRPHPYLEKVNSEIQFIARSIWPRTVNVWVCPEQVLTAPIWKDFRNTLLDQFSISHIVTFRSLFNIPLTAAIIIATTKSEQSNKVCMANMISSRKVFESIVSTSKNPNCILVKQIDLKLERIDPYYYKEEWSNVENHLNSVPTRTLESLASIKRGLHYDSTSVPGTKYRVITAKNISNNSVTRRNDDRFYDEFGMSKTNQKLEQTILSEGDILVSLMGTIRIGVVPSHDVNEIWVANAHLAIIRGDNNKFIADLLIPEDTRQILFSQLERQQRGSSIRSLSPRDLYGIKIPEINIGYEYNNFSKEELSISTSSDLNNMAQAISSLIASQAAQNEILNRIDVNVLSVKETVDKVLSLVEHVSEDLDKIKAENRSSDEKLFLISKHMDDMCRKISDSAHEQIKFHYSLLENSMASWDVLDELSREFLAMADYLYSKLQTDKPLDFSPAILQYCRSLEHELAQKTFIPYISRLISNHGNELALFLEHEKGNKDVEPFVKAIKKCERDGIEKFNLALGQMEWILNLATGKSTVATSPLLKDLRDFISSDEHKAVKIDKSMLTTLNLKEIIDMRNQCAHPSKLERASAEKCKNIIPPVIDIFEGCD
ncbi:MAG: hypothetical protein PHF56_00270 [Desulfuromonadaceae bacterium]|nr:hypothetical protein [Desulfuromonadaceae bacterium]